MEFRSFSEIKRLDSLYMEITQKIHGTNAQIVIYDSGDEYGGITIPGKLEIKAGSRNRWLTPDNDNYDFAKFVEANKEALIEFFGIGIHYGEWAGPGINSGEGLKERTFVSFETELTDKPKPSQVIVVPILYKGPLLGNIQISDIMNRLEKKGSVLVPGFMRPEGIVIKIDNKRFKKVFKAEETAWKKPDGVKNAIFRVKEDYNHLCQPIRLEKLLSKDESYTNDYPNSLPIIASEYMSDLIKEGQIVGDEDQIKAIRKKASKEIFNFIRTCIEAKESA